VIAVQTRNEAERLFQNFATKFESQKSICPKGRTFPKKPTRADVTTINASPRSTPRLIPTLALAGRRANQHAKLRETIVKSANNVDSVIDMPDCKTIPRIVNWVARHNVSRRLNSRAGMAEVGERGRGEGALPLPFRLTLLYWPQSSPHPPSSSGLPARIYAGLHRQRAWIRGRQGRG
jgi:hypothetical protein